MKKPVVSWVKNSTPSVPFYNAYCFFAFVSEYKKKVVFFLQITPSTDLFPSRKSGTNLFTLRKSGMQSRRENLEQICLCRVCSLPKYVDQSGRTPHLSPLLTIGPSLSRLLCLTSSLSPMDSSAAWLMVRSRGSSLCKSSLDLHVGVDHRTAAYFLAREQITEHPPIFSRGSRSHLGSISSFLFFSQIRAKKQ
jgi:hypothetical protein